MKIINYIPTIFSYYLDITNNKFYYQGNIQITEEQSLIPGLQFYPIKIIKDDVILLNKTQMDDLPLKDNNATNIVARIYNYDVLKNALNGTNYPEDVFTDSICPYTNVWTSNDKSYIFLELNNEYCINNSKNKTMVSICEDNQSYINFNSSSD